MIKHTKVFALGLVLVFAFAVTAFAAPIKDLVMWETANRELRDFNILHTEESVDTQVLCNAWASLLELDNKGRLVPAIAKEWGTNDGGLTWTFKLRDDVVWYDINGNEKAKCTAQDWITAMEWILNFHKNEALNTSMFGDMLKGATEYYEYTKALPREEALKLGGPDNMGKLLEMVGIEAPDDYTLVYHCKKNAPYFDTLCVCGCFYPLAQGLIDELGIENVNGMDNQTMWYNGPYFITTFIMGNEKVLTRNPKYWDKDAKLFDSVTIRIIADANTDDELFATGEVDQCTLNESNLRTIWNDPNHPYHNYLVETQPRKNCYQFHLNYAKNKEDGTPDDNWNMAVANENFRRSLYFGVDLLHFWSLTNFIEPTHCENLGYSMRNTLFFSDGTDYREHVIKAIGLPESDGKTSRRYNPELAAEFKAKAIEELTAKGVTFPVEIDYHIINGSQTALDEAVVLKESFEALGTDYVKLNIKTYVSSKSKEVLIPRVHSMTIAGWGADYGDPETYIAQEIMGSDSAYYARHISYINLVDPEKEPELIAAYKEFTDLAHKASMVFDDMDKRYQAYVEAEASLLNHALTIPAYYAISWQITKINDYSKPGPGYGSQGNLYKNWETNDTPYTTAEYAQFVADRAAGK